MKKLTSLILMLYLFSVLSVSAFAVESEYLIDNADLLTEDEEIQLLSEIENTALNIGADVVILTTPDFGGTDILEYADDFYDNGNYSPDGVLFVISMAERDYGISTCGTFVDSLNDYAIDSICETVVPDLSGGNYYSAFSSFLNQLDFHLSGEWYVGGESYDDSFLNDYDSSDEYYYEDNYSYDNDYYYSSGSDAFSNVFVRELILVVLAVIIAVIITSILKSKMNTAVKKHDADDYVVSGSFRLDLSRDLFIGSSVTRRPLPKNNNNHSRPGGGGSGGVRMSSGGVRHGGRAGKF